MANHLESVRVLWSATDEAFFRIAAELFQPSFLQGAAVLLASYDPELTATDAGSSTATFLATAAPAPSAAAVVQ